MSRIAAEWIEPVWSSLPADLAALAVARANRYHVTLASRVREPEHPMLRRHLEHYLLPAAAVYLALRDTMESAPRALEVVRQASEGSLKRHRDALALLSRMPGAWRMLRFGLRKMVEHTYPGEGWDICCSDGDPCSFGFEVRRCFYSATLSDLGIPELAPVFCFSHDYVLEATRRVVESVHTGTIGVGDSSCRFRHVRHTA